MRMLSSCGGLQRQQPVTGALNHALEAFLYAPSQSERLASKVPTDPEEHGQLDLCSSALNDEHQHGTNMGLRVLRGMADLGGRQVWPTAVVALHCLKLWLTSCTNVCVSLHSNCHYGCCRYIEPCRRSAQVSNARIYETYAICCCGSPVLLLFSVLAGHDTLSMPGAELNK